MCVYTMYTFIYYIISTYNWKCIPKRDASNRMSFSEASEVIFGCPKSSVMDDQLVAFSINGSWGFPFYDLVSILND